MSSNRCFIGIDVGGTKCAGGVVALPKGRVLVRQVRPTLPERGGEVVLLDVIDLCRELRGEAARLGHMPEAIGIGVAEMVSPAGLILSEATIAWRALDVQGRVEEALSLVTEVEADVRAAAQAEAVLGAGRGLETFLYITVGTGISCSLVLDGEPYFGAQGLTGTFASESGLMADYDGHFLFGAPLEDVASGPALARRLAEMRPEFAGTAEDVLALAESGDTLAELVLHVAGHALGAAIAHLVNVLDPEAVVIGGGLGLTEGRYRKVIEKAMREYVYMQCHRDLPLISGELGTDAGWIGAAFEAASLGGWLHNTWAE